MGLYTSAASEILDKLWEGYDGFAAYFHLHEVSLRDLGHLLEEIFVPAYLEVKNSLDPNVLASLQHQISDDVMTSLLEKPGFRVLWDEWDENTRLAFLQEPTEEHLSRVLFEDYREQFAQFYVQAYETYRA